MKVAIINYLFGIRRQDPRYKIPTMLVLSILLTITLVEGPHTTVRYFTGAGCFLICLIMGTVKI
jgi:hypothetical protein